MQGILNETTAGNKSIRIRIQIRIQGAKPMRIHPAPDTDPGQTF
jgi:hypothetical protein